MVSQNLKIGVLRTTDSLPVYMAYNKKIFEECGADVELIEFGSASDQSKAMESGAINAMMTDLVVPSLLKKGGTDMRVVTVALGANTQEGQFVVVSNKDSGIKSLDDSEGKTIGISEGTAMEYFVDSYFSELGQDISKVEKVNIPSLSLRFESLLAGEIDMAILPDPLSNLAIHNGSNIVVDDTKLENNYSVTVIAFSTNYLDNNRAEVEKFMDAYNKAIEQIGKNDTGDLELIYSVCNVPDELKDSWEVPSFTGNKVPEESEIQNLMKWMVGKKLIDKEYSYMEIVDDSFCKED